MPQLVEHYTAGALVSSPITVLSGARPGHVRIIQRVDIWNGNPGNETFQLVKLFPTLSIRLQELVIASGFSGAFKGPINLPGIDPKVASGTLQIRWLGGALLVNSHFHIQWAEWRPER